MSAIAVRTALPADAAAIAGVQVRSWQAAYRGLLSDAFLDAMSVDEREARWREILRREDGTSYTLVATRTGAEVMGFCSVIAPSRDDDAGARTCEIAAIYVEPDAWRSGTGRALLATALQQLRRDEWHAVTLWVFADNQRARAFYAGFGFEQDGREQLDGRSGRLEVRLRAAPANDGTS